MMNRQQIGDYMRVVDKLEQEKDAMTPEHRASLRAMMQRAEAAMPELPKHSQRFAPEAEALKEADRDLKAEGKPAVHLDESGLPDTRAATQKS